jgi:hypothetical protein
VFDIIRTLPNNHKNMDEKQTKPEASFNVADIYDRLDQAIYDHKEQLELYGHVLTEEIDKTHKSAVSFLNTIKESSPSVNSQEELTKKIDDAKMSGVIDDATYRLLMSQV